ncbi:MAG: NAD(P)H-dependent oxidoreductase subunit E, partial [Acidimicrobiales bacterium]|nr:NAD(P)H-dependent oxidoreductase subunit E [Acidimicrobiales bacterium]
MSDEKRSHLLDMMQQQGGLSDGVSRKLAKETGVPEAHVFGTASFYHLLDDPSIKLRVCQGLSCKMFGAEEVLAHAKAAGMPAGPCSCLAACDRPVAAMRERVVLPDFTTDDIDAAAGDWEKVASASAGAEAYEWLGAIYPAQSDAEHCAIDLAGAHDYSGNAMALAQKMGDDAVIESVSES